MTIALRPARTTDAAVLGRILWQFQEDNDWMPDLYSSAETTGFCATMIAYGWVTVAELDDRVAGFLARDGEEVCALYLDRFANRKGVGLALIDDAKAQCDRLTLRTFQANAGARRFYRRQGFVEMARGDGSDNEENLPEITLGWTRESAT